MSSTNLSNGLRGIFFEDLSRVVEKTTLMRMAFEAVDAVQWPKPMPALPNNTPEPVLRTLIPFCYCVGIFSSLEIEVTAKNDPSVRYLCANDFPAWEQIRQFRRRNISCLRETLARMLHSIYVEQNGSGGFSFFAFLAEADRRLALAVESDSAAMDN